ncbi:16S rRNA (uracil(1498)-N(3))-methyltransferase [Acetobacter sp. AN02]|uniref:16S rRNA (uracil(1498)-N(3))-methyltransferase n=1 Tax=Acetobacter sp. AN02 TaxID=2894186 RepID=UPI0024344914|nr:16S rRNA (uracil(1498)-N(3))-methyltransferase [Acetobacter sp. AN02]MDG6095462.1 16S rRNA (uracil(1498)-N(3))-methyltransferase [Acetobacter sp. AN02]
MSLHTLPRLHAALTREDAAENHELTMTPEQARYLGSVLRRESGDEIRLFSAEAGEWLARIDAVRKDRGSFRLVRNLRLPAPETGPVLAFALLKRDATDLVVRMGTELGVSRFMPVMTERTMASRVNVSRLETIAMEASEQCERLSVPSVDEPVRLAEFLGSWPEEAGLYVAVERYRAETRDQFAKIRPGDGLLTGPEGGFSDTELDVLRSRTFVTTVSLGSTVLRAETAVVAGLALMTVNA